MHKTIFQYEARHIEYSSKIINWIMSDFSTDIVTTTLRKRINDLTLKETDGNAKGYSIIRLNESVIRIDEVNPSNEMEILRTSI